MSREDDGKFLKQDRYVYENIAEKRVVLLKKDKDISSWKKSFLES